MLLLLLLFFYILDFVAFSLSQYCPFFPQSFFFSSKIWLVVVVVVSRCWVVVARTTVTMAPSWLHRGQLLLPFSQGPAHLQGRYCVRV